MAVGTAVFNPKAAWAPTRKSLWPHFSKPHDLADNIISMLHKSEHTQNYVGEYLLSVLPPLAERTHTADPIIRAERCSGKQRESRHRRSRQTTGGLGHEN
jgi:hypothetical protein